ncbi:CHAT domain-containing protein [Vasconcelosia minhoensis]|uniref:CHAT domain-containing protein n=1 Tax=Vasconcelosia minhoensis TaxID=3366354 RepID=UPI00187F12A0|nr:CHAT domain-containing protein [Romeria gracilis]
MLPARGMGLSRWVLGFAATSLAYPDKVLSEVTPALDGTGSQVTQQGEQFRIEGGSLSTDGRNLFHSFEQFTVEAGRSVNFLSASEIQNIFGRISGSNPAIIDGLIQVSGSSANLYLLSPVGIVFGPNASLNLPASFTATTAVGTGFGESWLEAGTAGSYEALVGAPSVFTFATQPGVIVNAGNLTVGPGQSLNLIGGLVANTGTLAAPDGAITLAAVTGDQTVRLSQAEALLSLTLEPGLSNTSAPNPPITTPADLPTLLRAGQIDAATGLSIEPDGTVHLVGEPLNQAPGATVAAGTLTAADEQVNILRGLDESGVGTAPLEPSAVPEDLALEPVLPEEATLTASNPTSTENLSSAVENNGLSTETTLSNDSLASNRARSEVGLAPLTTAENDVAEPARTVQPVQALPSLDSQDLAADIPFYLAAVETDLSRGFEDYLELPASSAPPATLDAISATLQRAEDTLGIKPATVYIRFSDADRLTLLMMTSSGQIVQQVEGVTPAQVKLAARSFRQQVTDAVLPPSQYLPLAQQLYGWLIKPIETDLEAQRIDSIAFVLDDGLRLLPLAALHDGDEFLVERYSVGILPTFGLTDFSRFNPLQNASTRNPVLAMGMSEFADQSRLAAVPLELMLITQRLWGGKSYLNDEFTLANLQSQLQQKDYGIVHFATHAVFNPGAMKESYLQLWDRKLQFDQMRQLNFQSPPISLLVLSACSTAVGDRSAEYGFAGLAVNAGAQTVMASLWPVSDEGTLGFMDQFYQNLKTTPSRSEALQQAQIAMLRGEVWIDQGELRETTGAIAMLPELAESGSWDFSHPAYWSAFTMIGNPW